MSEKNVGLGPLDNHGERDGGAESGNEGKRVSTAEQTEAVKVRAARARLIEETGYRLTDLFTIVSARIEMLIDKAPDTCREELQAIRKVVIRGVDLNKRLFLAVQACRREIGLEGS